MTKLAMNHYEQGKRLHHLTFLSQHAEHANGHESGLILSGIKSLEQDLNNQKVIINQIKNNY